ncbi:class I SAM-dependent methyltransferase [Rhizobium sp. Leaf386]|uniref:class I SAM-dependent methyltransferase n=1 Tax=Rhizobium sp. Leaf386 TaxID=1736359 RepID=UPI000715BD3A|nr:class I SAM-dependent methyltransferase [Rhizobium sp. Leaf386]KQT04772.1 SAM-dependent methyltransferase [Rhizobium sp. Leaf386]
MNFQTTPILPDTVRSPPRCRICNTDLTHTFVDLGMSPPCESFVQENRKSDMECYYPLHAYVCEKCLLVQLEEHISPKSIFEEYAYFSSYSVSWVEHARIYCHRMVERFGLNEKSLVVELASNDGYLLQHFAPLGIPVLGVEPAINVAKVAQEKGITTRVEFFGTRLAETMVSERLEADLIVGNNVLAQVPDINNFVAGIKRLLKPDGVVTLEFPHIDMLIKHNQFDTIYHEHFSYFSLLTIRTLATMHGLKVFDVEEMPTHGGSLRVFFAHEDSDRRVKNSVSKLVAREIAAGLGKIETYTAFAVRAQQSKRNILRFLVQAKEAGRSICGYGAPGKGNTLLNYCGIGRDFLDFTVDLNPYKHGRYTPGMHIPIRKVEAIDAARPDYVFILPWNLKDEIIQQMRHIGDWGGKFVIPIPSISVIDPKEMAL